MHRTLPERAHGDVAPEPSPVGTIGQLLSNLGRRVLPREAVAAAPNGGVELRQVELERVEDLIRVVLGAEQDLAPAPASVLDDDLGGTFRPAC